MAKGNGVTGAVIFKFRVAFVLNSSESAGRQQQDNERPYQATGTPKSLDQVHHGRRSDRPDADERTGCSGKGDDIGN